MTLTPATKSALLETRIPPDYVEALAGLSLAEDVGGPDGIDITTQPTISGDSASKGQIVARAAGIIAGIPIAAAVFEVAAGRLNKTGDSKPAVRLEPQISEGSAVLAGDVLAVVEGSTQAILIGERTALNVLCRVSGVATHTFLWAQALAGTGVQVLDTRKTTPGLRALERYAVRAGGGVNNRMGLFDVAMIKDNHIQAAGSITLAYQAIRKAYPDRPIHVEVRNQTEAEEALAVGARFLLCDNMSVDMLREVVIAIREIAGGAVEIEATGGLTLENAKEYASTGVDYLAIGGLTHSSPIVDIALDLG